jgi:hypothetical protein
MLSGKRPVPAKISETCIQMNLLINILDRGPRYKVRQFLERNFLESTELLGHVKNGDFDLLQQWAKEVRPKLRTEPLPISNNFLRGRLPEHPVTLLSTKSSVNISTSAGKSRVAKIVRRRKKSGK